MRYSNDVERVTNIYKVDGPIRSPWRVVMIGRDLNTLVNSDLVNNLSDPPDKTLFLAGSRTEWIKPSREIAVFARRSGQDLFLAAINGPVAREITIPLTFLKDAAYQALEISDHAEGRNRVNVRERIAARNEQIKLNLPEGGGYIARFSPK